MRKIETLLDLWKYRCEHYENGGLDRVIMDWQTTVKEKATALDPVINKDIAFAAESLLKPEPFTTKILHQLLLKQKDFHVKFLERIGFKTDLPDVRTEYHEKIKNYTNSYDISFWEDGKLVCIVENKLGADFSSEKEYTEAGKKIKNPRQLDRYCQALVDHNAEGPTLATLTKYCVQHHQQVKEAKGYSGIKFNTLLWCDIIDLLAKYQNTSLVKQAIELFKSDYFLLHESGCACDNQEKSVKTEFFIDRIRNIFPDSIIHQGSKLKHRHIVLLPPEIEKKTDWCGGFMALSLWFECYAVTGRDIVDTEAPSQVKNNAVPFFDVVLRCYYTIDGKTSAEYDEKVKSLETAGYIRCKVFADDQQKKIKHEYLRKSLASYLRISDKETLEKEINNTDSEFWTFLTDEISAWQKIVCNN